MTGKEDKTSLYVYIGGPYSQGNTTKNVGDAIAVWNLLTSLGYIAFIPHLYHFIEVYHPKDYETWLDVDMKWLEKCDCMFRIPGYSPGADREEHRAGELGIPVFTDIVALAEYQDKLNCTDRANTLKVSYFDPVFEF